MGGGKEPQGCREQAAETKEQTLRVKHSGDYSTITSHSSHSGIICLCIKVLQVVN